MPRLVPIKCPTCGADLRVGPQQDVVYCGYCHTSCFVRRPGAPAPMVPPGTQAKTAIVDLPRRGLANGMIFAMVVSALATVAMVIGVVRIVVTPPVNDGDDDTEDTVAAPVWKDPLEPLTKAVAMARRDNPRAVLVAATFQGMVGGRVDVAKRHSVVVQFEYPGTGAAPGGHFSIMSEGRELKALAVAEGSPRLDEKGARYPIDTPRCSAGDAWARATSKGVSPTATYTLILSTSMSGVDPTWTIMPKGSHKFIIVNAHTCEQHAASD